MKGGVTHAQNSHRGAREADRWLARGGRDGDDGVRVSRRRDRTHHRTRREKDDGRIHCESSGRLDAGGSARRDRSGRRVLQASRKESVVGRLTVGGCLALLLVALGAPSAALASAKCPPVEGTSYFQTGFFEVGGEGIWCSAGAETPAKRYTESQVIRIKDALVSAAIDGGQSGNKASEIPPAGFITGDEEVAKAVVEHAREIGGGLSGVAAAGWYNAMAGVGSGETAAALTAYFPAIAIGVGGFWVGWEIGKAIFGDYGIFGESGAEGEGEMFHTGAPASSKPQWLVPPPTLSSNFFCSVYPGACVIPNPLVAEKPEIGALYYYTIPAKNVSSWVGWMFGLNSGTAGGPFLELREKPNSKGECYTKTGWSEPLPNQGFLTKVPLRVVWGCKVGETLEVKTPLSEVQLQYVISTYWIANRFGEGGLDVKAFPQAPGYSPTPLKNKVEVPAPAKLTAPPAVPHFVPGAEPLHLRKTEVKELVREVIKKEPEEFSRPPSPEVEETMIEIPAPNPSELGTVYKSRLETLGFTKVELDTLSEAATDPGIGPEQVSYTVPAEHTAQVNTTNIVIEQNPATASTPPEGGGGSEPSIPRIKFPEISTPCTKFPFGIPCWLVSRLLEFSATGKAPKTTAVIDGKNMVIDLSHAEVLMEIVRGAELVLGTIAAVLLFGRFASSKTGSSGGGDDD
jgi:hypothetical protein